MKLIISKVNNIYIHVLEMVYNKKLKKKKISISDRHITLKVNLTIIKRQDIIMWPKALLLGDSQTQLGGGEGGWAQLLTDQYVRRLDIINRGFSGLTSPLTTELPPLYLYCRLQL